MSTGPSGGTSPISPARLLEAEPGLDLADLADLADLTLALRILSPDSPNLGKFWFRGEDWLGSPGAQGCLLLLLRNGPPHHLHPLLLRVEGVRAPHIVHERRRVGGNLEVHNLATFGDPVHDRGHMLLDPCRLLDRFQGDGRRSLVLPARLGQGGSQQEGEGSVCSLLPALSG